MKIQIDTRGDFKTLRKHIADLSSEGYKTLMVFHAEGGIDQKVGFRKQGDALLKKAFKNNIHIFGGIFPGIVNNGKLMSKGSIIAGIKDPVHIVTLEDLREGEVISSLAEGMAAIDKELDAGKFKTLFVFGDGFGELNLNLITALNRMVQTIPLNVLGGLTGRNNLRASHFNIFTPKKLIQNGAVLAFTSLESGIGVQHGWSPLPDSNCEITSTNGCYVEEINHKPAFDFYLDFIDQQDPGVAKMRDQLLGSPDLFFDKVAIKYPLGIIRKTKKQVHLIDRTAVSVGADRSLQFSTEIPEGTRVCILHLKGNSSKEKSLNIKKAAQTAYIDSLSDFPSHIQKRRVIVMDCFGRKRMAEQLGQDYEQIEFKVIAGDQKDTPHSPMGPLTFGEISSMKGGYVELHNKTAVVSTMEDN